MVRCSTKTQGCWRYQALTAVIMLSGPALQQQRCCYKTVPQTRCHSHQLLRAKYAKALKMSTVPAINPMNSFPLIVDLLVVFADYQEM